jgi:mannose-6-phosphate isomerase-like protein (cupin superfamily)
VAGGYTLKNLREVANVAAEHGITQQEARFPREDLGVESLGIGLITVKPGERQPFAHRHDKAEEVYVVLRGGGRIKLDDEVVELSEMDAIRLSPGVTRMAEAGPDGLELLAFGPRHKGDAEIVQGFWD